MSTLLFEEYVDSTRYREGLDIVEALSVSCPYIMWNLLVARFHTCANLYWQLFWQNYTVLGSNFQVSAKTRHFYYQQPFPFPLRLKELFLNGKYLYLMIERSKRHLHFFKTKMHYFNIYLTYIPVRLKELFLNRKYLYLMIVLSTRWEKEKTFTLL